MTKSYDLLINSQPYVFGPTKLGGGLDIGSSLLESGTPRQMGTILIPSAHHGYGQRVVRDPQQAEATAGMEVVPGAVFPAGQIIQIAGSTANCFSSGAGFPDRSVAGFFENDTQFLIFPRKILAVDDAGAVTTAIVAPADFPNAGDHVAYTSVARWRGKYIIGIESKPSLGVVKHGDTSQRYGRKYCEYDIATDTFTNKVAVGDVAVSHIAAGPNVIFRAVSQGLREPTQIYFGDDPTVDFGSISWVGPIEAHQGGYCTGLFTWGPHLLIFKREGVLLGMDIGEVFSPLITTREGYEDDLFGFNAKPYLHYLLIPAKANLLRFNPNTLQQANLAPGSIQGYLGTELGALPGGPIVGLATRHSDEVWCVTRGTDRQSTSMSRGVTHRDGFHWTNIILDVGSGHAKGGEASRFADDNEYLIIPTQENASPTNGRVLRHHLYGEGFGDIPAVFGAIGSYNSSRISADGAANGLTVIPTQVRLWHTTGAGTWELRFSTEEGIESTLASFGGSTGGVAALVPATLSPRIGRYFRVAVAHSGLTGGQVNRIDFPIAVDYEFIPAKVDAITMRVYVNSDQQHNLGGEWIRTSGREAVNLLLALRNTTTAIQFPDSDTAWTVYVRAVEAQMVGREEPRTGSPAWLVTLDCVRLT